MADTDQDRPLIHSEGNETSGEQKRRAGLLITVVVGILGVVALTDVSGVSRRDLVPDSPPSYQWSIVADGQSGLSTTGFQSASGVTTGGPGIVAVGSDGSDAAVWTSADGITWARVPHDATIFGGTGGQLITGIANTHIGLVAVGSDGSDAAVWTSGDGVTWARAPAQDSLSGEGFQSMISVTTVEDSTLVAVGSETLGGETTSDEDAAVWTSDDGVTWTRVPHNEVLFGGEGDQVMRSVTSGDPGVVAVGIDQSRGDTDAAVWTSADGLTWLRIPHKAVFGGEGLQSMISVAAEGRWLVAVGSDRSRGDTDAAVWTSAAGITWVRATGQAALGGEGFQVMRSVSVGGLGVVAVGGDASNIDLDAAMWMATLEG